MNRHVAQMGRFSFPGAVLAVAALAACGCALAAEPASRPLSASAPLTRLAAAAPNNRPANSVFPDFGYMVSPADYEKYYADQPIFRLKTDFPRTKPATLPEFMKIDFHKDAKAYILAVRDYAFDGNLPDWNPFNNTKRGWYHIPWLHPNSPAGYPPNGGTEGFRGLIKEASIAPLQLGPGQKGKKGGYSVYAITLVNGQAGYTLGKMWADPANPDPRATDRRYGGGFPEGTVFAKLLFTDAPQGDDSLAFMKNPLTWKAYITENFSDSAKRVVTNVNLLQMDIAVRDSRARETGWVMGTFVYNGEINNSNKFLNMVPVGLMWGNDPAITFNATTPFPPRETRVNPALKETVIFSSRQLPPQHLGWNGRLNGPADLNTTSCLSCHNAAQYPALTSLVPLGAVPQNGEPAGGPLPPKEGGSRDWMKWFRNQPAATSSDPRAYSTDFSFQVAISLTNFYAAKGAWLQGNWASEYGAPPVTIGRGGPIGPATESQERK